MLIHQFAEAKKPARVALLGARGFISIALAEAFRSSNIPLRPVSSSEVDLADPSAAGKLGGILTAEDTLIVAAALTPDKGRDTATLMKNLRMAEHVGAALAITPCAHVIYISSDAVYDSRSALISEQSSCEPTDLYAVMHIAREKILALTCQGLKIPFAAIRPCAVYGPGDTHNSYGPNRFIRTALAEGIIRLFGEGEEIRDHVYIRDVAEILRLCVVHRSAGVLNAVSGNAVSFRDVAQQVASVAKREVKVQGQPRSGPITHRHFDNTALMRCFPSFQPTPLSAGISEAVAAMSGML